VATVKNKSQSKTWRAGQTLLPFPFAGRALELPAQIMWNSLDLLHRSLQWSACKEDAFRQPARKMHSLSGSKSRDQKRNTSRGVSEIKCSQDVVSFPQTFIILKALRRCLAENKT